MAGGSCTDWSNLRHTGRIYDFRRYWEFKTKRLLKKSFSSNAVSRIWVRPPFSSFRAYWCVTMSWNPLKKGSIFLHQPIVNRDGDIFAGGNKEPDRNEHGMWALILVLTTSGERERGQYYLRMWVVLKARHCYAFFLLGITWRHRGNNANLVFNEFCITSRTEE